MINYYLLSISYPLIIGNCDGISSSIMNILNDGDNN